MKSLDVHAEQQREKLVSRVTEKVIPVCSSKGQCFFMVRGSRNEKVRAYSGEHNHRECARVDRISTPLFRGLPRPLDFGVQVRVVEVVVVPEDTERMLGK